MKIVADRDIYNVTESFSSFGELELFPGRDIGPEQIEDADALLVRTTTPVNSDLLENSTVRFVGSASAGIDHLDIKWLDNNEIQYCHAPGCNADAVVDYFFSAISQLAEKESWHWLDKTVGIVGCGNVGSRLANRLSGLGMPFAVYDPFLDNAHNHAVNFKSFDEVMRCDIVTLHTPLTNTGTHPTYHLINEEILESLSSNTILINASRGAVVDNKALDAVLKQREDFKVILDVWEDEPEINNSLLDKVSLGTPHIAGYSEKGKFRATHSVLEGFCKHFSIALPEATSPVKNRELVISHAHEKKVSDFLIRMILEAYSISADSLSSAITSADFDRLRNSYKFRAEFSDYQVASDKLPLTINNKCKALGFRLN